MSFSIEQKITAGFFLVFISLTAVTVDSFWHLYRFRNMAGLVDHTYQVQGNLETLLAVAEDAEDAKHGYLTSGKPQLVDTLRNDKTLLEAQMSRLNALLPNPDQQTQLKELSDELSSKIGLRPSLTRLRPPNPLAAPTLSQASRIGEWQALAKIRSMVKAMQQQEKNLLNLEDQRKRLSYRRTVSIMTLGGLMAISSLVVSLFLMHRELRRRRRAERALQEANEALEEKVRTRTANLIRTNDSLQREIAEKARAEARLAASNRDLDQFAAIVSHDLQSPLNHVRSYIELLKESAKGLSEKESGYMERLQSAAQRMGDLIRNLLQYSRYAQESLPLSPVNLSSMVQDVLSEFGEQMASAEARVRVGDLPTVSGNRTFMRQVFQNLIQNALKFSGGAAADIDISAVEKPAEWEVRVQDRGVGIDPLRAGQIFEFGRRLSGTEKIPGQGVGLAFCKKIIERHGGRIWVEPAPGRGSIFCFTLPRLSALVPAQETRR